jgi:hypothetical protein
MSAIPDDVRRFVLSSVPSVPYLEAALLLHAQPGQERSAAEVAARLYVTDRTAAELLRALCQAGLAECTATPEDRYRYAPKDAVLAATIDALARVHAENLIGVTQLIHDAMQKSAQRFADAFRLRKDK